MNGSSEEVPIDLSYDVAQFYEIKEYKFKKSFEVESDDETYVDNLVEGWTF
jgi:hypothetical protein